MMALMHGMVQQMGAQQQQLGVQQQNREVQDQQIALLRDGLLAAQKATATAIEKAAAPKEQRPGSIADFRRLLPKTFAGTERALDAEQWLVDVTNLLSAARVPEADKVEVIAVQLTDVARSWWLTEEARLTKPISWKQFSDAFLARFFPATAKKDLQHQFMNLKQMDRSVEAYAAEFIRLSRFAPKMVEDEVDRAERFQQGLQWDLQVQIASQPLVTYDQVLTAARRVEHVMDRRNKIRGQNKSGKRPFQQVGKGTGNQKGTPQAKRPNQANAVQTVCEFCKKIGHIRRDCRLANGLCLICGAADHQMTNCPKFKPKEGVPALPAPPARRNNGAAGRGAPVQNGRNNPGQRGAGRGAGQAYNLTTDEADRSDDVVAGKVSIHSVPIMSLFDSGASHCFISSRFVDLHVVPSVKLKEEWEISTGNGIVTTNRMCKSCPVEICGRKMDANMFVLETKGYDAILGMTWLSKHHAVINCRDKSVTFRIPDEPEFQFIGEDREFRRKNRGDCGMTEVQGQSIPVVEEFMDVFAEIPGLPPDREVEFNIDLLPGTSPISKPPHRMARPELEELKNQI
jgi:hypothetical protein